MAGRKTANAEQARDGRYAPASVAVTSGRSASASRAPPHHESAAGQADQGHGTRGGFGDDREDARVLEKHQPLAVGSSDRRPSADPCVSAITAGADGTERERRVDAAAARREARKTPRRLGELKKRKRGAIHINATHDELQQSSVDNAARRHDLIMQPGRAAGDLHERGRERVERQGAR